LIGWDLKIAFFVLAGTGVISALSAFFFIKPQNDKEKIRGKSL